MGGITSEGSPKVVEIDESMFFKRKYNRGRITNQQWFAYNKALRELPEYLHLNVNHSINFVDPEDPDIHTQNIEGLWSRSKYYLRKKEGLSMEKQFQYLIQFMWVYRSGKRFRYNYLLLLLQHADFAE